MSALLPQDLQTIEIYRDFLPRRVIDAHVHLYQRHNIPHSYNPNGVFCRESATVDTYIADVSPFFPNVEQFGVHAFPMPDVDMNDKSNTLRESANQHILTQAQTHPLTAGSVYVMQGDTKEDIARMVESDAIRGIKCYWFSAGNPNGEECSIGQYLPESAWEIANAKRMPIVLHMMHPHALSDERNLTYILAMTKKYPQAQLILAHCARAFAPWTVVKSVRALSDRENIWFDSAAICEPSPMMACMLTHAERRLLWGTDYPICLNRGKVISIGSRFHWLIGDQIPTSASPSTVLAESLLALYQSALLLDLDQTQIDRIFYHNAAELLKL